MELIVRPGLRVSFENENTEKSFIAKFGMNWQKEIKKNFLGQPDGGWLLFKYEDHPPVYIFGSIPIDEDGEFYVKPSSGLCRVRHNEIIIPQLIRRIEKRTTDIFGDTGMDGNQADYKWLSETYGITEEEDNIWLDILYHYQGILTETASFQCLEETEQDQILSFVQDDEKTLAFLVELLSKYDKVQTKFPRPKKKKQSSRRSG